jgi:hypothetical protein
MVLFETIFVGLSQLRANKLRSILTLLGIVIGVSSVIRIVSIGEGLRRTVVSEFARSGGAGTVLVRPPDEWVRRDGRSVKRDRILFCGGHGLLLRRRSASLCLLQLVSRLAGSHILVVSVKSWCPLRLRSRPRPCACSSP